MAFVINQSASFKYPVTLPKLQDDGSITRHKVTISFKRLSSDEIGDFNQRDFDPVGFAEVLERVGGDKEMAGIIHYAESVKSGKGTKRVAEMVDDLMQVMADWQDVANEEGPMTFNRDNLEALLQYSQPAYRAILEAFREATGGEGKRKN